MKKPQKKNLEELFKDFIYECRFTRRLRPETLRGYEGVFSTLLKRCPDITLESLTPEKMTEFFHIVQIRVREVGNKNKTKKEGVKDSTIATYASKLHTFFDWLVVKELLNENPLLYLKRVNPVYDDIKALRKEDIDKIRAAIENHSDNLLQLKRDRMMLSVLIFCGLRRGELLGLRVFDIQLEKQVLLVNGATSKSKRDRRLPIEGSLIMHLQDYLQERNKDGFYTTPALIVSLNRNQGLTKDGLKHWVERLKELSGVKFHLHQFRHTFATNLAVGNVNAMVLQILMGHTDLRMTAKYLRSLGVEDLRPAVTGLSFEKMR